METTFIYCKSICLEVKYSYLLSRQHLSHTTKFSYNNTRDIYTAREVMDIYNEKRPLKSIQGRKRRELPSKHYVSEENYYGESTFRKLLYR